MIHIVDSVGISYWVNPNSISHIWWTPETMEGCVVLSTLYNPIDGRGDGVCCIKFNGDVEMAKGFVDQWRTTYKQHHRK